MLRVLLLLMLSAATSAQEWTRPDGHGFVWPFEGIVNCRIEAWSEPWPPRSGKCLVRVLVQASPPLGQLWIRHGPRHGGAGWQPLPRVARQGDRERFQTTVTLAPEDRFIELQVNRVSTGAHTRGKKIEFDLTWPLPHPSPPSEPFARVQQEILDDLGVEFQVKRFGPFVAASDLPATTFAALADFTLVRCAAALHGMFFQRAPNRPVRAYLCANARSYERLVRKATRKAPPSPFGFFSAEREALYLNAATGDGTIVHEMTHALTYADFPACPVWLFEGLGSLYEQPSLNQGVLRGHTNWRLASLQKALRKPGRVSLRRVLETSRAGFFTKDTGLNYAVSRYLCQYLQERGRLTACYRAVRAEHSHDITGIRALEKTVGQDLESLERDWLAWVRDLSDARRSGAYLRRVAPRPGQEPASSPTRRTACSRSGSR